MRIRVKKSGGFTGITDSHEIEIEPEMLPSSIERTVKDLIDVKGSHVMEGKIPKGAADYLSYTITINDGVSNRVIECNQFNMDKSLKSLIEFVYSITSKKSSQSVPPNKKE